MNGRSLSGVFYIKLFFYYTIHLTVTITYYPCYIYTVLHGKHIMQDDIILYMLIQDHDTSSTMTMLTTNNKPKHQLDQSNGNIIKALSRYCMQSTPSRDNKTNIAGNVRSYVDFMFVLFTHHLVITPLQSLY